MEEFVPIQKQPYDMLLALIEQLKHPIDEIFAMVQAISILYFAGVRLFKSPT